jgi:hypothetical protein
MKTLFLAVLSLVLMQPVGAEPPVVAATEQKVAQGLEPGRYLISCKQNGGREAIYRGYLLTIGKDGKQSLEAATIDTSRVFATHADSVTLTKGKEGDDSFILQAKFTDEYKDEAQPGGKVTSITTTCVLALSFRDNGSLGSGSELRVGEEAVNLTATIGRLPDPEPAK